MHTLALVLAGFYMSLLFLIIIYSLGQFQLLVFYLRNRKRGAEFMLPALKSDAPNLPFVTVQLPLYNELYVVERLIDCVTQFDYPKDRFEIHVLDDSTDETIDIVQRKVDEYKAKGFNIEHVRRPNRKGFKAGALSDAMYMVKGEFIAIFDADFLPHKDFLLRTIPYFLADERVGVVQTRWEHLNRDYSLITKLQAMQLDVHFTVEQLGRASGDCFLQFNGTGGLWRRTTIDDAGGWEADTLTEDLDLSYRAQLKGWRIAFIESYTSPAELPAEMNALKSQQFRWTKGGAEVSRKMLPVIWNSHLSMYQKMQGSFHLLGSTMFVIVFIMALMNIPIFFLRDYLPAFDARYVPVFYLSFVLLSFVYYTTHVVTLHQDKPYLVRLWKLVSMYPMFLVMSIGMSLHNTVAVLEGWRGKQSPFVRTPKFNITTSEDKLKKNVYTARKVSRVTIFEALITCVFISTCTIGIIQHAPLNFILFHGFYALGFGTICFYTLRALRYR